MKKKIIKSVLSAAALSIAVTIGVQAEEPAHIYEHTHREEASTTVTTSQTTSVERTKSTEKRAGASVNSGIGEIFIPKIRDHRAPSGLAGKIHGRYDENYRAGVLGTFKDNGKYGLLGTDGTVLVQPQYKEITAAANAGQFWTKEKKNRILIDKTGRILPSYTPQKKVHIDGDDGIRPFHENGKYGFKDSNDKILLPPVYKEVLAPFSEGIAFVRNGKGKKVAVDTTGRELFDVPYDELFAYRKGLAEYHRAVHKFNWGGVLGVVLGGVIDHGTYYGPELSLSYDGIKRGYIDRTGAIVIDSKNDEVWPISDFGTFVKNKGKLGYVNRQGRYIIAPGNYDVSKESWDDINGNVALKDKETGKYAIFSVVDGVQLTDFAYDNVTFLSADRLSVTKNKVQYLIDGTTGAIVATFPEKAVIYVFGDEYTWVNVDKKYSIIDKAGRVLYTDTQGDISGVTLFNNGLSIVKVNGLYGVMDVRGAWVVKPRYKEITRL